MKRKTAVISVILAFVLLCGCSSTAKKTEAISIEGTVTCDMKFGSAVASFTPEEFQNAGISLGDSCDVIFENGYTLTDVPYYDGYYIKNACPVIISYPGYGDVKITLNNLGIWDTAELENGMTVSISLNMAGKYATVQEALGQQYSTDRAKYESDEQFVNFRALAGGHLKQNCLFRGASPVDNSRGRAPYADALLNEHSIGFVVDLADSEEDIAGYMAQEDFSSAYTAALYENGSVVCLDMGNGYQTDEYKGKVVRGLREMLSAGEVPVYIHCMEGKDRTGFVCMLLEALSGASYEEMLTDYMITYDNYYGVSGEKSPEKYDAIADLYFNSFASALLGTEDLSVLKSSDYVQSAVDYLVSGGMSESEVRTLTDRITE